MLLSVILKEILQTKNVALMMTFLVLCPTVNNCNLYACSYILFSNLLTIYLELALYILILGKFILQHEK